MADTKISGLTAAGALAGTEIVPVVQTTTKRVTLALIAAYVNSLVSIAFSSLTGKPTTLSGYGITDAQPLDSDLTAIAALSTSFGRSLLAAADAAALRTLAASAAHDPSIQSVTSSATVTPTFADDQVNITAQAAGLTLANPTGTAVPAWGIVIRIKDNGTARTIAYGTQYRGIGVTLPTTTVVSKTLYLGMIYNSTDTKWDVGAVWQEG